MRYQSIFRPNLFQDQTILVTGGGTGIGRAIAHELASLGANIIIAARKEAPLEATTNEIIAAGGRCAFYTINIRREADVQKLIETIVADHGTIDALVNNAGGQFPSPAEHISQKGWHAVIETNLTGTFNVSRAVFNQVMGKKGGNIVNIVADMWNGFPGMAHTGAARAGVVNLTKTLAVEWAARGVRINSVAPGVIHGHGLTQYDAAFIASYVATVRSSIPAKRLGTESEIAAAVTFLLSPAAAYITGETLRVDGGSSLWRKNWEVDDHENNASFDGFVE
ncbi:MAG: SDR family oxidoreductase [Candidatus Promineifilaceae bacterium]